MVQKKLFIDWDISPRSHKSIFVDLDPLLKSRFIVFQVYFIWPLNFETLVALPLEFCIKTIDKLITFTVWTLPLFKHAFKDI